MEVSKESVICSRHYLRLFLDGHQIYVQQGRNHEYVDVLMLCSKHKSRELAQKYVMKHIVEELISFCASPKGCPGVALVLGVIQTLCVEMLNPSHFRAILIEKLKSDFICSINDKLEEMMLESSHLVKKEELFNYEHRWPRYENQEGGISERARDLLWLSDVEAVVDCIRQKQIQKFESLQEDPNSLDNDLAQSNPEDSGYGDAEFGNDGDEDWRDTLSAEIGDDGDEDGSDTLSAERVSAAARIAEKALRVDCSNAECFQF
ncbi:hypothetical protein AXG93_4697s1430 [Marchantia polymorpha subsp. ruderalis]|uniref:Uncharacterized protein n=1 Tax=Marchantia polymorpha subsp. ruderalis TaxID=1480154 RepID=A0A176VRL8_MARPO|nr:hypothetical protein AXG93_4697s1430 [Marchantia polymorpha subsp. ruderalis]